MSEKIIELGVWREKCLITSWHIRQLPFETSSTSVMHLVRRAAQLAFHILLLNFNFVNFLGFQQCLPVYIFIVKPVNGTRRTHRCPWCLCRALLARQRHLSQTLIRLDTLKGSTFRRRWGRGRREIARVNRISIFFLLHIYHLRPARYIKCQYSKQTSIRTRAYS